MRWQAKSDPDLKSKIDAQLRKGGDVIITTGLLKAVPEVIGQFVQCRLEGDVLVNDFGFNGKSDKDILMPRVRYFTNDAWDVISAGRPLNGGTNGFPLMLRGSYAKGNLYVLSIPWDYSDIYELPAGVLDRIRAIMCKDLKVRLEGPAKVSLFVYDNDTFIVESFLDTPVDVKVVSGMEYAGIEDLVNGGRIGSDPVVVPDGPWARYMKPEPVNRYSVTVQPHSYRVFRLSK